jgi:hypothetical protein
VLLGDKVASPMPKKARAKMIVMKTLMMMKRKRTKEKTAWLIE